MTDRFRLRDEEVRGVYRAIFERRDIRNYRPDPVPEDVLARILVAAHHAPSVGFMQPWSFLLVEDRAIRERVYAHFREVNERAAEVWEDDRRRAYQSLKLQGILDAPLNLVVTCDPTRGGTHVLGRFTMPETDVYSTCLAVENLWLAARAEGVGVGWMSLMEPAAVRALLGIPEHVLIVAYLTLGYPVDFPETPMLESVGWARRRPVDELVFRDRWGEKARVVPAEVAFGERPAKAPDAEALPIVPPDAARRRNDELTKPKGSLGRLEDVGLLVAGLQGTEHPVCERPTLLLFAGDHGITKEGVSAYLPETTAKMVYQYLAGGAVVNALARQHGVAVRVVDVGVDHDFGDATGLVHAKVRRGTRSFVEGPAMTRAEVEAAIAAGRAAVASIDRADVIALGEMGIGNTTASAAIVGALLGLPAEEVVGRGTGVGDRTLERKIDAVRRGLALHASDDPTEVLARLGGFEIAAMVGAIEEAAERRALVVLDGFITGAAALVAVRRNPGLRAHLLAAHQSAERAHGLVLEALGLVPLFELGMRLGEGSGAVLGVGLVKSAIAVLREVRTFEEANIERPLAEGASG